MTTVAEQLRAARELIAVPERWTQGALARGKSGKEMLGTSRYAICWCAMGAIEKVTPDPWGDATATITAALKIGFYNLSDFNDTHTHAEVIAAFDKAIAQAEASQ